MLWPWFWPQRLLALVLEMLASGLKLIPIERMCYLM